MTIRPCPKPFLRSALVTLFTACLAIAAGSFRLGASDSASAAILALMTRQQDAWNAGNVADFVQYYADDCIFFGSKSKTVGREAVRQRYEKRYPTPEAMGKLTFSQLEVKQLDAKIAMVLGHFHLERTAAGGGDADGVFSLVLALRDGHWQIVLDHTS